MSGTHWGNELSDNSDNNVKYPPLHVKYIQYNKFDRVYKNIGLIGLFAEMELLDMINYSDLAKIKSWLPVVKIF